MPINDVGLKISSVSMRHRRAVPARTVRSWERHLVPTYQQTWAEVHQASRAT